MKRLCTIISLSRYRDSSSLHCVQLGLDLLDWCEVLSIKQIGLLVMVSAFDITKTFMGWFEPLHFMIEVIHSLIHHMKVFWAFVLDFSVLGCGSGLSSLSSLYVRLEWVYLISHSYWLVERSFRWIRERRRRSSLCKHSFVICLVELVDC